MKDTRETRTLQLAPNVKMNLEDKGFPGTPSLLPANWAMMNRPETHQLDIQPLYSIVTILYSVSGNRPNIGEIDYALPSHLGVIYIIKLYA